jgi:hypothetical protein
VTACDGGHEHVPPEHGVADTFAVDLAKLLIGDSLQFLRGQVQTLQAVLGLLLTGYVALLIAVWKEVEVELGTTTTILSLAPVAIFVASLCVVLARAVLYRPSSIVLGSVDSALDAYEKALAVRRSQLVLPGILGVVGIVVATASLLLLIDRG